MLPARVLVLTVLALGPGAATAAAQQAAPDATDPAVPPSAAASPAAAPLDQTPISPTRTQVRRLQRAFGLRADGTLGVRTRSVLRRWERREGLRADGRPDPAGLGRLGIALTPAQLAALAPAPAPAAAAPAAVAAARSQLGTPYARAGATPGGFDCSGLTSWAWSRAGLTLPHSSFAQAQVGAPVATSAIQPGDLVFFDTAGPGASDVGIATSPTTVISATTHGVREHPLTGEYWGAHLVGARRVTQPA